MGHRQSTLENLGMTSARPGCNFWSGKRVLLTGHTGFKGGWLVLWLHRLGAEVTGISLQPNTDPNLFDLANIYNLCHSHFCDIRDAPKLTSIIKKAQPEIVFHLAAQPLVRESYRSSLETFSTNVMGTAHVLDALRDLDSVLAAVMVTTDKVYRNNEWFWAYREDDVLGGHDPYSASKAAAEIVISSYRDAFLTKQGVAVASARAGNVIGGGDWSADRLIPDAVRAWQSGKPLNIRHPNAIRPWQHVLEPLTGYLALAATLVGKKQFNRKDLCSAFNFGPATNAAATVKDAIELARTAYRAGVVNYEDHNDGPHEAGTLALDAAKARALLGITPQWSLAETVQRTMAWYHAQHQGADARTLCETDITDYEALL
jgi:CDP-glucose 4,6-dehydratase